MVVVGFQPCRGARPPPLARKSHRRGWTLFLLSGRFPGGVGNTWGNAENFASLIHDVETKIFDVMPDDTVFYPGHGKDSTLGVERPSIPDWWARGW